MTSIKDPKISAGLVKLNEELQNLSASALEWLENPNRCPERNDRILVLKRNFCEAMILTADEMIKVFSQFTGTSPALGEMKAIREDLKILRKTL